MFCRRRESCAQPLHKWKILYFSFWTSKIFLLFIFSSVCEHFNIYIKEKKWDGAF